MRIWKLIALCTLFAFSPFQGDKKIAWSKDFKLSWDLFEVREDNGNSYVASTNSGLSFGYGVKMINGNPSTDFNYEVQSYFYPELSWFVPSRVNDRVLRHEQTHFDITELHARKLRKRISEFDFTTNLKEELDNLYNNIEQERRAMQAKFDFETDHSVLKDQEDFWEEKVANLLLQYEAFQ